MTDSPKKTESRIAALVPVLGGVLVTGVVLFVILAFAGAGAGTSGTTSFYRERFLPVSLGLFGGYLGLTVFMLALRRDRIAFMIAWGPLFLIGVWSVVGFIAGILGLVK